MRSKVALSTGHSTVSRGAKAVNGHDEYLFNLDLVDEILKFNLPDAEWWRSDYNCEDIAYPARLAGISSCGGLPTHTRNPHR